MPDAGGKGAADAFPALRLPGQWVLAVGDLVALHRGDPIGLGGPFPLFRVYGLEGELCEADPLVPRELRHEGQQVFYCHVNSGSHLPSDDNSPSSSKPTESDVRRLQKLEGDEAARRVEVVLSRVVHDAHVVATGGGGVREGAKEPPDPKALVGVGIYTEQIDGCAAPISRGREGVREGAGEGASETRRPGSRSGRERARVR